MKKDYSVTSLAGALLWSVAVLLRRFSLPETGIVRFVTDVLPNFGIIWLIVGLAITFWPYLTKKVFPAQHLYALVGAAFGLTLLSEIVHALLLNAVFDVWDMVVSLIAAGWLAAAHSLAQRHNEGTAAASSGEGQ